MASTSSKSSGGGGGDDSSRSSGKSSSGNVKRGDEPPTALRPSKGSPVGKRGAVDSDIVISAFQDYCSTAGTITGDDALDILEELGVPATREQIQAAVPSWQAIDLDSFLDLVEQLRGGGEKSVSQVQLVTNSVVVALPLLAYLRYVFNPFARAPPNTEYRLRRVDFTVSPRTLLIFITAFALFVVGACIIVLMYFLWTDFARRVDEQYIVNFNRMVASFVDKFDETSLERHGAEMRDGAEAIGTAIAQRFARLINASVTRSLRADAAIAAVAASRIKSSSDAAAAALQRGRQRALAAMASRAWSSSVHETLWNAVARAPNGSSAVFIIENNGTVVMSSGITVSAPGSPLHAAVAFCHESGGTLRAWTPVPLTLVDAHAHVAGTASSHGEPRIVCNARVRAPDGYVSAAGLIAPQLSSLSALHTVGIATSRTEWTWLLSNAVSSEFVRCQRDIAVDPQCVEFTTLTENIERTKARWEPQGSIASAVAPFLMRIGWESYRVAVYPLDAALNVSLLIVAAVRPNIDLQRAEITKIADTMNFEFDRTTEIVVSQRSATRLIQVQATRFRFSEKCYGVCQRRPMSAANVIKAFETRSSGYGITPDYRPEPVMGAFSFIGGGLDIAYLIERDIVEINSITLDAITDTLNVLNSEFEGTLETHLVHFRSQPPIKLFNPNEDCSHASDCYSVEGYGVVFRSDCQYCMRNPDPNATSPPIEFLTMLRFPPVCNTSERPEVVAECINRNDDVARRSLREGLDRGSFGYGKDYRGVRVLSAASYIVNLSMSCVIKFDIEESNAPIRRVVMISIFVSIAILLLGLATLFFFSRNAIAKIEQNWEHFRAQTEAEKAAYSELVRVTVPSFIAWRFLRGVIVPAEVQQLGMAFIDVPDFTERSAPWSPDQTARFLSYYMTVMLDTADHYKLHKARIIGDACLFVAGFCVTDSGETFRVAHDAVAAGLVKFAVTLIQLCDPLFAHFPQRIAHLQRAFGTAASRKLPDVQGRVENVGAIAMPQTRIAIHYGPVNVIVRRSVASYDVDFVGPSVAVLAKLLHMTKVGCVAVTQDVTEQLRRSPENAAFTFAERRKVVVRGRGTVVYFHMRSADVPVPQALLDNFGIRRARRRITYGVRKDEVANDAASESMMSTATYD